MFLLFLIPLIVLLCFFFYWTIKFNNPYTTTFIFGKKGAGKSMYMVKEMIRLHKKGWIIYTDMQDINLPYVRIVKTMDFAQFRPEPRSAIFLDEVGISMDNRNFKSFPPGMRDFVKYVRKMRCKLIMNSQSFDVDKKVRDTTDRMILIRSIGCLSLIRPIKRTVVLTEPIGDSESKISDKLVFESITSWKLLFMPRWAKYFDSLSMPHRELVPYRLPGSPSDDVQ